MTDYVHGYSPEEQSRLTRMQELLNDAELEALDLEEVRSILDVGAGLGQMTRALARAAPPGTRVLGIERDPRQIAEARRQAEAAREADRVELRQGMAEDLPLLPAERGSFDLAHARFVLEHVVDPLAVVRQMVQAVRPGGRLVLVDDDHDLLRLSPELPALLRVWEIYWRSYARRGHDGLVGRRLTGLLVEAGAVPTRITSVFYGACQGMPLFGPVVDNLKGVLRGCADWLVQERLLAAGEMEAALEVLEEWRRQPEAAVWYSLPLAEGRRPEP